MPRQNPQGQGQGQPVIVLPEGTQRESGRGAQANNIHAAKTIAEAVRSTLGPRGMDKMLVDSMGDVVVTNDGATILKEVDVAHPAAKMIIEVAKSQDEACGDGTSSGVVLAGQLLNKAEDLLEQDVHATILATGFREAADQTVATLNEIAQDVDPDDKETLQAIARTALASKSASAAADLLAETAVAACQAVTETTPDGDRVVDIDNITVQAVAGGDAGGTRLVEGVILDKERVHNGMPTHVEKAKIALVDAALEVKKTEVDAKIQINDPSQVEGFLNQEEGYVKGLVDRVVDAGANVLVCQKGIDDLAQHFLAKQGVYAVRRAKKSDMEKLAKATGGQVVNAYDDLSKDTLGAADRVGEERIGDETFTTVTGCKDPKAVSILLRGGSEHVVDEYERALHDALSVVAVAIEDGKLLPGGGAAYMEAAARLREHAPSVGGREQLAVEAFADALEIIPRTLAENGGLDEIDVVIEMRQAHAEGRPNAGVDLRTGKVEDMTKAGIVEPLRVVTQAVLSATEAATMILRIDDVIASKESEGGAGDGAPGGGMPPGMGGGMPPGMMGGGMPPGLA